MIYTYVADIRHLKDPKRYPELLRFLDVETHEKILNCSNPRRRIEKFGTELLLKEILSRHNILKINMENEQKHAVSVHLSLSQSKNLMICAIGEKEVECSIKKIGPAVKKPPATLFSLSERKYLNEFDEETLTQEFYRLWACKESYIKMSGESISNPAKTFEVIISNEITIQRNNAIENCWIEEYEIPGYKISVCSKDDEFSSDVKFITVI